MPRELRDFDWHRFWVQEVIFFSAPTLLLVITSRQNPPLSKTRFVVLLVLVLVMTILNLVQLKFAKRRH